jgi:hypothetical protein
MTSWTLENATRETAGMPASPSGSPVILLKENNTTSTHDIYWIIPTPSSNPWLSVIAKAKERTKIKVQAAGINIGAVFDLSAGTIAQTDGGITSAIRSLGDGWYQCGISYSPAGVGYGVVLLCNNAGATTYAGDNNSGAYVSSAAMNLSATLAPYSPPLGLPQYTFDYSNHGNAFQLGSTATADTNDPTFTAQGLVFGADDYLVNNSLNLGTSLTIIFGFKAPAAMSGYLFDGTGGRIACFVNGGPVLSLQFFGGIGLNTPAASIVGGSNYVVGLSVSGGAGTSSINNTVFSAGNIGSNSMSGFLIGKGQNGTYLDGGQLYGMAAYNRASSSGDLQKNVNAMKKLCASLGVTI